MIDTDLLEHIEDDLYVTIIRDCQFVRIHRDDMTTQERRAAYCSMFNPCDLSA
jgi:hypothetical protein